MASVTFHPCCVASNRRKDGTYPVKIRVTFRGVSRRLPTTLVARPGDLTRSLHIKSPDIMSRANALIAQMQATLADLSPFVLEAWDVDRVVAHIRTALDGQSRVPADLPDIPAVGYVARVMGLIYPAEPHAGRGQQRPFPCH